PRRASAPHVFVSLLAVCLRACGVGDRSRRLLHPRHRDRPGYAARACAGDPVTPRPAPSDRAGRDAPGRRNSPRGCAGKSPDRLPLDLSALLPAGACRVAGAASRGTGIAASRGFAGGGAGVLLVLVFRLRPPAVASPPRLVAGRAALWPPGG